MDLAHTLRSIFYANHLTNIFYLSEVSGGKKLIKYKKKIQTTLWLIFNKLFSFQTKAHTVIYIGWLPSSLYIFFIRWGNILHINCIEKLMWVDVKVYYASFLYFSRTFGWKLCAFKWICKDFSYKIFHWKFEFFFFCINAHFMFISKFVT